MKKIIVQKRVSFLYFILNSLVILAVIFIAVKFVYFDNTIISARTKKYGIELVSVFLFLLSLLFSSAIKKDKYLSHILVSNDSLNFVYKKINKIVNTKTIKLEDIKKYSVTADFETVRLLSRSALKTFIRTKILCKNGETITFDNNGGEIELWGCSYQYIFDILQIGKKLPDFSLELNGNSKLAKLALENIKYYKRFGKKLSFGLMLKFAYKSTSKPLKITIWVFLILFLYFLAALFYMRMPAPKLSKEEKQYVNLYEKASDYSSKKQYTLAIAKLNEAQRIINTSSETYVQKAYCYKALNQCENSITEAKEGLKYVNKKSIYFKAKNYKFISSDTHLLYGVIGDCAFETEDFNEAINAYTNLINKTHPKYTNAYYKRGRSYYYLREFGLAKQDFKKHKEIIKSCLENKYCSKYDEKVLNKINNWLKACDKNIPQH